MRRDKKAADNSVRSTHVSLCHHFCPMRYDATNQPQRCFQVRRALMAEALLGKINYNQQTNYMILYVIKDKNLNNPG